MTYTKTDWNNEASPPISAENLDKMEQGIYDAHTLFTTKANIAAVDTSTITRISYNGSWWDYDASNTKDEDGGSYAGTIIEPDSGIGRWVRDVDGYYNVTWWGDSSVTDWRTNIQAAIDSVYAYGGGTVFFPTLDGGYNISSYLVNRPNVSLLGDESKPLIKNDNLIEGGYGDIFLSGNFHPDFTEDFTYLAVTTPTTATSTLTLTASGHGAEIGDQVFIASTETGLSGGTYAIPLYGWLNQITAVNGNDITFKYPIDVPCAMGVALLKNETSRDSRTAYFYSDASIKSLSFECQGHWSSDSANLNVVYDELHVTSKSAVYGNTFQETKWLNSKFFWTQEISEQSHTSLNTRVNNCDFYYIGASDSSGQFGVSIQEYARNVQFDDYRIHAASYIASNSLIKTINASDCKFTNGYLKVGNATSSSLIAMGDNNAARMSQSFYSSKNLVDGLTITSEQVGRVVINYLSARSSDNNVSGIEWREGSTSSEAIRLDGDSNSEDSTTSIKQCYFCDGNLVFANEKAYNYTLEDTYLHDGIALESGTETDWMGLGKLKNITKKDMESRRLFKTRRSNATYTDSDVEVIQLGDTVDSNDIYTYRGSFRGGGNTKDRHLVFTLREVDTPANTTDLGQMTILAANHTEVVDCSLEIRPQSGLFNSMIDYKSASTNGSYAIYNSSFSNNVKYELVITTVMGDGTDAGNSSLTRLKSESFVENLIWQY